MSFVSNDQRYPVYKTPSPVAYRVLFHAWPGVVRACVTRVGSSCTEKITRFLSATYNEIQQALSGKTSV